MKKKKNHLAIINNYNFPDIQTDRQTDMATLWPTRPRGPRWWKSIGQIGKNFEKHTKIYVYVDTRVKTKLVLYPIEDEVKAEPHWHLKCVLNAWPVKELLSGRCWDTCCLETTNCLYWNTLQCSTLHCAALCCTILHCIVLHFTVLYCTALHREICSAASAKGTECQL